MKKSEPGLDPVGDLLVIADVAADAPRILPGKLPEEPLQPFIARSQDDELDAHIPDDAFDHLRQQVEPLLRHQAADHPDDRDGRIDLQPEALLQLAFADRLAGQIGRRV